MIFNKFDIIYQKLGSDGVFEFTSGSIPIATGGVDKYLQKFRFNNTHCEEVDHE